MDAWLEKYQTMIETQPSCDDPWFAEMWSKYQTGDEYAGRCISGSCLRLALCIAQDRTGDYPDFALLDLVQEANAGLADALQSFSGGNAVSFREHATGAIYNRLAGLAIEA